MTIDDDWLEGLSPLHAGTGEILTIKGSNFGWKGNVLFRNADNPGQRLPGLDDIYVVNWTPTQIQVLIPSIVKEGFLNDDNGTAGSGTIVVKRRFFGFPIQEESETKLNIEYALSNRTKTVNHNGNDIHPRHYLAREHCLNGFVFTLHTSFMNNQPAIDAVEAALSAWSDELGITLELEKILEIQIIGGEEVEVEVPYFHDTAPQIEPATIEAKRNIIWFDPSVAPPALMLTNRFSSPDTFGSGAPSAWLAGSNIRIRPNGVGGLQWNYSISGPINYETHRDFYETILHELGHALGLEHNIKYTAYTPAGTIDNKNLMHPVAISSGEDNTGDQRINLNQHGDRAKAGAQRMVSDSRTHNWSTPFANALGVESLAASGVNSLVLPAPEIKMTFNGIVTIPLAQGTTAKLEPEPFNDSYDYYWNPQDIVANSLNVVPVCIKNTYYVRLKDAACTVSSVYSLPEEFPLSNCPRVSDHRDDEGLLLAYPNPTTGQLNIEFQVTEEKSIEQLDTYIGIYDHLGRLQHQHRVSDASLRQTTIDISTLPAGMYWVVWFADGEVIDTQQVQKTE